jgi:hypothetical protein
MGKGDGLGALGDGVPAKPVIPGLEDESDGFGDAMDADIVPGSGTMLGPASKPTSAGGFGGGLDFGSLADDDPPPKSSTSFGMPRPSTLPRKKFSAAGDKKPGLDLSPLRKPARAEPQGTALGAPGAKAPSRRRGDLLDSSLFGDSSTAEDSEGPSPMVVVPEESDAREEIAPAEAQVEQGAGTKLDFGSFGLSDAIDDAMRAREEKQASRNKTRLGQGMPQPKKAPSLFDDPEPASEPAPALSLAAQDPESSGVGLDLFGDEPDEPADDGFDPFGGAFGEEEDGGAGLDFASLAQAAEEVEDAPQQAAEPEEDLILMAGQPGMAAPSYEQHGGAHGVSVDMPPADDGGMEIDHGQADGGGGDDFWGQKDSFFGSADELVDTQFDDSAGFDPSTGEVTHHEPAPQAVKPAVRRPAPASAPAPEPVPQPEYRPEAEPPGRARRGASNVEKAKNALIIGGGALFLFLAVLIVLNDGFIDFKRFGVTLESAFTDKPFEPRDEWLYVDDEEPVGEGEEAPEGEAPEAEITRPAEITIDSASASWMPLKARRKKKPAQVVAVRGRVLNRSSDAYIEVRVRVMLLNAKEQIVAEKEVPVGGFVTDEEIRAQKDPLDAAGLAPDAPTKIGSREAQSFTAIFDEIPKEVTPDGPILFKVEFTKKVSEADLAK